MKTIEEKALLAALDMNDDEVERLVALLTVSEKDKLMYACHAVAEACEI